MEDQRERVFPAIIILTTPLSDTKRLQNKIHFFFSNCYDMTIVMPVCSFAKIKKEHFRRRLIGLPGSTCVPVNGRQPKLYNIKTI